MGRVLNPGFIVLVVLALVAGCQSLTGPGAGANVDDAAVTASVKTKLVADRTANLTRIDVDTNRGTVYLTGSVDTAAQRARAEQLAWQANGVKGVVNTLQTAHKR
jgi:hyperosmotically inducible periplasmic protein